MISATEKYKRNGGCSSACSENQAVADILRTLHLLLVFVEQCEPHRRESGRWMTEVDYHAWTAVRSIGEAITRTSSNDVKDVRKYLLGKKFGLGAYKGVKVSFRSWNGQMRQPILLAAPRSMVSVSPQEGYIHPDSELDTMGKDQPESTCKF